MPMKSGKRFLEARYWIRLWVQQELLLARSLIFAAGNVWRTQREISNLRHFELSRHQALRNIFFNQHDFGGVVIEDLALALPYSIHKQCADPRDHVYGILGILPGKYRACITVNYDLTVREVFRMANLQALEESGIRVRRRWKYDLEALGKAMGLSSEELLQEYKELIEMEEDA